MFEGLKQAWDTLSHAEGNPSSKILLEAQLQ